jgi:hypothetical protein
MRRTLLAWLLVLPLVALSTQLAHSLAYRLLESNALARAQHLEATGHSSIALVPLLSVITLVLVFAVGAAVMRDAGRGYSIGSIALWPFAVMPVAGYALQEVLERVGTGHGDLSAILAEPTMVGGLALQLPFALAAYAIARFILRTAQHLVRLITAPPSAPSSSTPQAQPVSLVSRLVPLRNGGACAAERAPPVPLRL